MAHRAPERALSHAHPPSIYPPPLAQPPAQMPFSDPFHTSRDPFFPGAHRRRDSVGPPRAWPLAQGNARAPHPASQTSPPPAQSLPPPPPPPPSRPPQPPPNGVAPMSLPYDSARRRSLGGAGSPPQYANGPLEPHPQPPSFPTRNMPPPSPPQIPPPSSGPAHLASAPRGPPTTSPFAGVRDLASFAPHRPSTGISISSILGSGDDRRPQGGSPHSATAPRSSTPKSMQLPSPGRARSSSMREGFGRREPSPVHGSAFGEPRAQSVFHERNTSEPRRDGIFASPQFQRESSHSFRAFRPEQEQRTPVNGSGALGRPNSQLPELTGPRTVDEIVGARRDLPGDSRFGSFRHFGEPAGPPRGDTAPRHDGPSFANGVTSQPRERKLFGSPHVERDGRHTPSRYQPGMFNTPLREDQSGLFRPAFQHASDAARESIESRPVHDYRREEPRSSPPLSDLGLARGRNGFVDRPASFEEHHRLDTMQREPHHRKENDGSVPRSLLGVSPELNRKGRNSPLPQAVQGAQPKHVRPGGDNPGIKMEFGRMFSGLGSGVGSATPTPSHPANGNTTPSRMSPARHLEDGDLVRTAVGNIEEAKTGGKMKPGKKTGRRSRDEEVLDGDGRATPDLLPNSKRMKTTVPPHHHHHHHLHSHHHHHPPENAEPPQGSSGTIAFSPNPGPSHSSTVSNPAHHHHHHHHHPPHARPAHHHHHHHAPPRSAPTASKPSITVINKKVLESISGKPRKHLGSQLYTAVLSQPANADIALDAKIKFNSTARPLPLFKGKENCTYTIRVPRYYLRAAPATAEGDEPSSFEEICKRRQLWGTDVYTDDSDVVAAAVHSGWLKGDFGEFNEELQELDLNESAAEDGDDEAAGVPLVLDSRPSKPTRAPRDADLHITILICPPLEEYVSSPQHHMRSRGWQETHDGMSFMIHRVEFVDEGPATRYSERGMTARKQRLVLEEAKRREAAAGLLMCATGGLGGVTASAVSVGA